MGTNKIPESLGQRPKGKNPLLLLLQGGFCPPKTDTEDDIDDILSPVTPNDITPEKSRIAVTTVSPEKKSQSPSVEPLTVDESTKKINGKEISDSIPKNDDEPECCSMSIYPAIFVYVSFILILYLNRNCDIMEEVMLKKEKFLPNEFLVCIAFFLLSYVLKSRSEEKIIEKTAK